MKKGLTISLAVLMVFGLATVALAGSDWKVEFNAAGFTTLSEVVKSGHLWQTEELVNYGSVSFEKYVYTEIATFDPTYGRYGMKVTEFKDVYASGATYFQESDVIGGLNWQRTSSGGGWVIPTPTDIGTGYIKETVVNDGEFELHKDKYSAGDYHLDEYKEISGSGRTSIDKVVSWWTNSPVEFQEPKDLTDVQIEIEFDSDPTYFYDELYSVDSGAYPMHVSMDISKEREEAAYAPMPSFDDPFPVGKEVIYYGSENAYGSFIDTDEDFNYTEWVVINPLWTNVVP